MFGLVMIQSEAVRGAADQIKQYAQQAKSLPESTVQAAQRAESANRGFMMADGAKDFADDLEQDMKELNEHWEDTAEVLEDIAEHWDRADEDGEADFSPIEGDLQGFQVPRIAGA